MQSVHRPPIFNSVFFSRQAVVMSPTLQEGRCVVAARSTQENTAATDLTDACSGNVVAIN
jgi:hypothetical protein